MRSRLWVRRALAMLMVVPATVLVATVWPPYREEWALRDSGRSVRATVVSVTSVPNDGMRDFSVSGTEAITLRLRYAVDGATFEATEPPIDHLAYDGSGFATVVYDPAAPRLHRVEGAPRSNVGVLALELVAAAALYFVAVLGAVRTLLDRRARDSRARAG